MRRFAFPILVCLALNVGCFSAERDNPQDPYNTPILRILEAAYEQDRGTVVLRWEYLGREAIQQFRVFRKVGTDAGFEVIAGIKGDDISTGESGVVSFRDTALVAGEVIQYSVSAEGAGSGLAGSDPVPVRVAGAKMSHLGLDHAGGAVRVFWNADAEGAAAYEVVRSSDKSPGDVVYRTEDVRESSWIDSGLRGDLTYTYAIRTVMVNGVRIDSRTEDARFYELGGAATLRDFAHPGGRIQLFDYPQSGLWLGAFVWREKGEGIEAVRLVVNTQVRTYTYEPSTVESRPVDIGTLAPTSLSASGSSPHQGPFGAIKMYLSGIDPAAGQAVLKVYGDAPDAIFTESWPVDADAVRTATCWTTHGLLLVAAGGQLRAFNGLLEAGSVAIGGEPGDLLYVQPALAPQNACVWAALPDEGRMLRGELEITGERLVSVTWHDVPLPAGAQPVALMAYIYDQVFALDAGNRQVLVFDASGQQLLHWPVPAHDAEKGDIATTISSGRQFVHVWDGTGRLFTYVP